MAARNKPVLATRIFYFLFTFSFGWVFLCSVFANKIHAYHPLVSAGLGLAFFTLLLLVFGAIKRQAAFFKKHGLALCLAVMLVTGILQVANGLALRFTPSYDMDAIYGGGIFWAENGSIAQSDYYMGYFHMFPNNMGALYMMKCLFSALRVVFPQPDYFAAAVVLNAALLQAGLFCTWDVLRRLAGHTAAAFGLVLYLCCVPFYMMGAVFYTDALSLLFPILALDLFLILKTRKTRWARFLLGGAMGLCIGVGTLVKLPTLIMLIAIFLAAFVEPNRPKRGRFVRKILLPLALAAVVAALVLGAFQLFVSHRVLDEERLEREAMPYSHWVAMGLIGEGGYDEADYARAMALPSRTARQEVNKELISRRLTEPTLIDLAALFTRKAVRCFGDGTYGLSIFLDDDPHSWNIRHDFVLYAGKYYPIYAHLVQGMYLAVFALALYPAVLACLSPRRGWRAYHSLAPFLAFFGLLLFLLMWETNSRYTLNYMPILFVCAGVGAFMFRRPLPKKKKG